MNDDSIATHMHCHVLSVLLTGPKKKKKKKKKINFVPFHLIYSQTMTCSNKERSVRWRPGAG